VAIIVSLFCFNNYRNYNLKRLGLLSIQFYRILLLYNLASTITVLFCMTLYAIPIATGSFLFAKVVGFLSAVALHNYSHKQSYFYFRNAGYHMRQVIATTFAVDVLVYLIITLLGSLIFLIWHH